MMHHKESDSSASDITNTNEACVDAKGIRLLIAVMVVSGTDPAEPPVVIAATVHFLHMRGGRAQFLAALDL